MNSRKTGYFKTMTRKQLEYEQAPSGYVTLYNYKEPFMKFRQGFGFMGVLVFDGETDKIQCHYCGEWFENLSHHLHREHNMKASEYKEAVGLLQSTALLNEEQREKLIQAKIDNPTKNFNFSRKGVPISEETKKKISEGLKKNPIEKQNRWGTCPLQLIDRLKKLHDKLGRTPRMCEIGFIEAIENVYGGMKQACAIAGIPYRKPSETVTKRIKYTKEEAIKWIRNFYIDTARLPISKDYQETKYGKGLHTALTTRLNRKEIEKEAMIGDGVYRKTAKIIRISKPELLKFLTDFEKLHHRKPSYSDCKRGLLPGLSRYSYNFGSWKEALTLAFKNQ